MHLSKLIRKNLLYNGVYCITNTVNNKKYIGSSAAKDYIFMRATHHFLDLKHNKHHNIHLQSAFNKYGEDNFLFEILEVCEPSLCIEREQHWIDSLKPEYNIAKIAGNTLGAKCSDDTKLKISKMVKKFYENPLNREKLSKIHKGKKLSKETIQKMIEKNKGRKLTNESKEKISKSNIKNYKSNLERKEKRSIYMKNRIISEETLKNMKLAAIKSKGKKVNYNGETFTSITEVADKYNISKYSLYDTLRGKTKKHNIYYE